MELSLSKASLQLQNCCSSNGRNRYSTTLQSSQQFRPQYCCKTLIYFQFLCKGRQQKPCIIKAADKSIHKKVQTTSSAFGRMRWGQLVVNTGGFLIQKTWEDSWRLVQHTKGSLQKLFSKQHLRVTECNAVSDCLITSNFDLLYESLKTHQSLKSKCWFGFWITCRSASMLFIWWSSSYSGRKTITFVASKAVVAQATQLIFNRRKYSVLFPPQFSE